MNSFRLFVVISICVSDFSSVLFYIPFSFIYIVPNLVCITMIIIIIIIIGPAKTGPAGPLAPALYHALINATCAGRRLYR